jgi:hypothetical protein
MIQSSETKDEFPNNWTLETENTNFLKFVKMQGDKILLSVMAQHQFKKWYEKRQNPKYHTSTSVNGVCYIPKIDLEISTIKIKIRPHNVNIILSDGTKLKEAEINSLLASTTLGGKKIKCDFYLDKLCYAFSGDNNYFFVYTAKTIRFMEPIDKTCYQTPVAAIPTRIPARRNLLDDDETEGSTSSGHVIKKPFRHDDNKLLSEIAVEDDDEIELATAVANSLNEL